MGHNIYYVKRACGREYGVSGIGLRGWLRGRANRGRGRWGRFESEALPVIRHPLFVPCTRRLCSGLEWGLGNLCGGMVVATANRYHSRHEEGHHLHRWSVPGELGAGRLSREGAEEVRDRRLEAVTRHIAGFEYDKSGFKNWLYRIAYSKSVDLRRERREQVADGQDFRALAAREPPRMRAGRSADNVSISSVALKRCGARCPDTTTGPFTCCYSMNAR
jgi:hypothetical protein